MRSLWIVVLWMIIEQMKSLLNRVAMKSPDHCNGEHHKRESRVERDGFIFAHMICTSLPRLFAYDSQGQEQQRKAKNYQHENERQLSVIFDRVFEQEKYGNQDSSFTEKLAEHFQNVFSFLRRQ